MFFTKYIRNNKSLNQLMILLINATIRIYRVFIRKNNRINKNVAIIALHRLGDAVLTIPAIKNILDHHKTNIYLICYREIKPIYQIVFHSINFITVDHEEFFFNKRLAKSSTRKNLKKLKLKIIYDMTGDVSSASLIFSSSASKIIGINEPYYESIYTNYKNVRKLPHMVDNYLDGIRDILPIKEFNPNLETILSDNLQIVIHPFASSRAKEWGLNKFIRLAEDLNQYFNCLIISPPGNINTDIKELLIEKSIKLLETKTTEDLINAIKESSLLVGNDSGAVHIANLLGIPTFTIYGPTNPLYPKPLYGINDYILRQLPCTAEASQKWCFTQGGVFCPSYECMNGLSYDVVKQKIYKLIHKISKINA